MGIERRPGSSGRALVLHPAMGRPGADGARFPEAALAEAVGLAAAIKLDIVDSRVVRVAQPRPATLFGTGFVEEMDGIEKAIAEGRRDDVPKFLTDKWLAETTLFGPAAKVRDGVAAWRAAGVHTPILVPSSAAGNQMKAIDETFAAFA